MYIGMLYMDDKKWNLAILQNMDEIGQIWSST